MNAPIADELTYQGEPVSSLLRRLQDPDVASREGAAEALLRVSQSLGAILPSLSVLIDQTEGPKRAVAAETLGAVGARVLASVPGLRAALKRAVVADNNDTIRAAALRALVLIGPEARNQTAALIEALKEPLPAIRADAACALGALGKDARPAVAPLTTVSLRDPDLGVRLQAAAALWRIDRRVAGVVDVLVQGLRDGTDAQRWAAADCLGEMGPEAREAAGALRAVLPETAGSRLLRMSMELALERIERTP